MRRFSRSWFGRVRERRTADACLRATGALPPRFEWRAAELTSLGERRILARSLRGIVSNVRRRDPLLTAVPLNRRGLRSHVQELSSLAEELENVHEAVEPAGILLLRDLLTNGGSPLYLAGRIEELPGAIAWIRVALGVGRGGRFGVPATHVSSSADGAASTVAEVRPVTKLVDGGRA